MNIVSTSRIKIVQLAVIYTILHMYNIHYRLHVLSPAYWIYVCCMFSHVSVYYICTNAVFVLRMVDKRHRALDIEFCTLTVRL